MMVIGLLAESSVLNICCLLYPCRGGGEERVRVRGEFSKSLQCYHDEDNDEILSHNL